MLLTTRHMFRGLAIYWKYSGTEPEVEIWQAKPEMHVPQHVEKIIEQFKQLSTCFKSPGI